MVVHYFDSIMQRMLKQWWSFPMKLNILTFQSTGGHPWFLVEFVLLDL
jgi:hypothetical protein